jgi:hypothetical protein
LRCIVYNAGDMIDKPQLLAAIRERPALYLGQASLSALYHFLNGYEQACGDCLGTETPRFVPHGFHDWVAYRVHFHESTSGWKNMMVNRFGDGLPAILKFFEFLDEYARRTPTLVASLPDYAQTHTQISGGEARVLAHPSTISLVSYTDDPGLFLTGEGPFLAEGRYFPSLTSFELLYGVRRSNLIVLEAAAFQRFADSTV